MGSIDQGGIALDVWALLLPAMSFLEIVLVGRLKVSEVLAAAMLPWLLGRRDRLRVPHWFILLWAGWFISQVLTDIVVGSAFVDYSRGWAKILVTMTSFVAILALVSTPRRARLFALGLAFAGVAGYFVTPSIGAAVDPWKWALALPIGLLLAAALSGTTGLRKPLLPVVAFVAFGTLNLLLGYRSLGGVALMTSAYLLLNGVVGRAEQALRPSIGRALLGLVSCLVIASGVLFVYDSAAAGGLLGASAQTRYYTQSGSLGVLLGGRSESLVSTQAILDSPILGHGSWARDPKYVLLLSDRLVALGYEDISTDPADIGVIPAHSLSSRSVGGERHPGRCILAGCRGPGGMAPAQPLCRAVDPDALARVLHDPTSVGYRVLAVRRGWPIHRAVRDRAVCARVSAPAGWRRGSGASAGLTMKVSIVTISFNQARFLPRALASVLSQDYPDIEYIVVDPGSTDGSRAVIDSHRERLARVVLDSDNGPADGLNRGFEFATGDVLAYVNADDAFLPGAVHEAVAYLDAHPAVDVVYGDGYMVDVDGNVLRTIESSPFNLRRYAYGSVMVLQQATFIRRSAYDRTDGFNVAESHVLGRGASRRYRGRRRAPRTCVQDVGCICHLPGHDHGIPTLLEPGRGGRPADLPEGTRPRLARV